MSEFTDRISNEPDGQVYYNFIDDNGRVLLSRVRAVAVSELAQNGSAFSAREVNMILDINSNGYPIINLKEELH